MNNIEENPKNPTIAVIKKVNSPNHFLIKYKTEDERVKFSAMVLEIVKKHEVKDFHVEEKKAFVQNRILYNMHTIAQGNQFDIETLEKNFLEYYYN